MAPPVDTLVAMTDAFEGIDRLAEGAPKTDGAPNFRRVGFEYFICFVIQKFTKLSFNEIKFK